MDLRLKRFEPLLFFLLYLAVGLLFLRVLTDWAGFAVDEGYTTYSAQRLREGNWPYRDFFFLWTPGILAWHATLQELGCSWLGERASALVAAASTGALILQQAKDWKFRGPQRLMLAAGILFWGFSLWNIPHSSWYALPFALLGARLNLRWPVLAGICFGLAFWFKQSIGILSWVGAVAALCMMGEKKAAAKNALAFFVSLVVPFGAFAWAGGLAQALFQIFFKHPGLRPELPPSEWLATPLMLLGLWILGIFSLQPHLKGSVPRLLRVAPVVFLVYGGFLKGQSFFLGSFMLFSCLAWGLSAMLALTDLPAGERGKFWLLFLPALGAFLQVIPRADFPHFLFVFPPAFFFLIWGIERIRHRYAWLKGGILFLPAAALLWGGLFFQARVFSLFTYGQKDSLGLISYGWAHRVNEEASAVIELLRQRGLKHGDPILVIPNATIFYRLSGLRNPTPHNQFFPGYVEAYGDQTQNVLPAYEKAGGRYLVWQYKSGAKPPAAMEAQMRQNYRMVEQFPEHFSVWERKTP